MADQLQGEVTLRNLQWKMYRKARCLARLAAVDEPTSAEVTQDPYRSIIEILSKLKVQATVFLFFVSQIFFPKS